jgi:hypothetical protein
MQPGQAPPLTLPEAQKILSPGRLATYVRAVPGGILADALALYEWNIALGDAFGRDLHLVEVALRNALHEQLSTKYGTHWFLRTDLLDDRCMGKICSSWQWLDHPNKDRNPHAVPAGKVIASLQFGMWVDLLDAGGYAGRAPHRQRRDYEMTLWRPALAAAFTPPYGLRKDAHRDANRLRHLRNRVAHHEPIFDGLVDPATSNQTTTTVLSLNGLHQLIGKLLNAVCPAAERWRQTVSQVPAVLARTPPIVARSARPTHP